MESLILKNFKHSKLVLENVLLSHNGSTVFATGTVRLLGWSPNGAYYRPTFKNEAHPFLAHIGQEAKITLKVNDFQGIIGGKFLRCHFD